MKTLRLSSQDSFVSLVTDDLCALAAKKQGPIHIALPGGRSVAPLIRAIVAAAADARRFILYLVDERLEGERNETTLLEAGLQQAFDTGLMKTDQLRIPVVGERLSTTTFDRVYLGVGEDGHIASLYPSAYTTEVTDQVLLITDSPKPPPRRATLSFSGFEELALKAKVFLLFFGEGKREALQRMLHSSEGPLTLPCAYFKTLGFDVTVVTDLQEA
jgi:6-phosphogluconolactonase